MWTGGEDNSREVAPGDVGAAAEQQLFCEVNQHQRKGQGWCSVFRFSGSARWQSFKKLFETPREEKDAQDGEGSVTRGFEAATRR